MKLNKNVTSGKRLKFAMCILVASVAIHARPAISSDQCAISIFLKNGDVLHCDSGALNIHKNQIGSVSLQGRNYHSAETDSIIVDDVKGIPLQDRWIFEKKTGNISLFTSLPAKADTRITFISKKDSVRSYSLLSLSKFVADNSRSRSLVEREMIAGFLGYIPMAIGISYAITQIFHTGFIASSSGHMSHGLYISPVLFAVGVAFCLPCYLTRNNAEKAINNYNSIDVHKMDK